MMKLTKSCQIKIVIYIDFIRVDMTYFVKVNEKLMVGTKLKKQIKDKDLITKKKKVKEHSEKLGTNGQMMQLTQEVNFTSKVLLS